MAPRPPELDDPEWLAERAGQSTYKTAEELGCSQGAVYQAYKRQGVALRKNAEAVSAANTKHGGWARRSPAYDSWRSMVGRCKNPNDSSYPTYGGAGITVCDRWVAPAGHGFINFLEDMGERPKGLTLDRIDPYGNYEPGNCRWADVYTQRRNRREGISGILDRPPAVTCVLCGFKFARGSGRVKKGPSKDKGRCTNKAACDKRQRLHRYR